MTKEEYADRICPICKALIPANEKYCLKCGKRVGRENKDKLSPGAYKGYVKKLNNKVSFVINK